MPSISNDSRHIAIIGGGIIGCSTLYYLVKDGLPANTQISLIEEAPNVAPAASGKSGGFLALDWHGADTASLARLSFDLHRQLAESDGGEKKWGYRNVETISIGFDDSKTRNKCPDELKGWLNGKHVISASNMGGNGTTAQATPLPLVEHLVEQAKALGKGNVNVLCSTRAERLEIDDSGHVKGLAIQNINSKEQETLPITDVVVAAGPWTGKLIKTLLPAATQKNIPRYLRNAMQITGSRAHSIVIKAPQPTTAHCLFTDMHYMRKGSSTARTGQAAGAPEVYCREDGTVYACGESDDVPLPPSATEVTFDKSHTKNLIEVVSHLSPSHLSIETGAKIEKEQACYLPISRSGPIIAGDQSTGIFVAAGHSCWGITLGLGTGKVVRQMLFGEKLSANISALQ
ncbi:hypothetical protein L7F22_018974 [Adiantum nelumboides]|nr:hypothetical protein [Adiantum nelumboides]